MLSPNSKANYSLRTATATIKTGSGKLIGFYVNSTTGGTMVFHDATSAANAVTGTITPAIGWHFLPMPFRTGLHLVIANTISVTLIYE